MAGLKIEGFQIGGFTVHVVCSPVPLFVHRPVHCPMPQLTDPGPVQTPAAATRDFSPFQHVTR